MKCGWSGFESQRCPCLTMECRWNAVRAPATSCLLARRSRLLGALNDMHLLQPKAQEMLASCSALLISCQSTHFPQVAPPEHPSPPRPRSPDGTHLRPHWKRLGAEQRLAIPFYTCPTGLSQQNLKKEKNPSGLWLLSWLYLPELDWMLPGPSGGDQ